MGRGRAPCCAKVGLNKGSWTPEEDMRLIAYIRKYGHANWRALPKLAGLLRCGKSCRLRWINYLSPDIKRGNFTNEEEETIIRLHNSLGNKWSKIASHLPGRTDNEIKNVWHTHIKKKLTSKDKKVKELTIKETPSSSSSVTTNLVSNINSNEVSKHDNEDTRCKDMTINFNCVDSTDTYVEPSFDLTDLSFLEMNSDIFSPIIEQYYNSTENNVNSEMNLDEIPLMKSPCSSSFKGDVFEQETSNSIEGGGNGTDCSNLYNMDDHFEWNPRSFEELGECNKKEEWLEELERELGLQASSDQDNLEAVESCLWMEGDPVSNYFQDDSPAFSPF